MTQTGMQPMTCRGCQATGETVPTATAWRCPGCQVLWKFPSCRTCSRVSWVKVADVGAWTCPHCGEGNRTVDLTATREKLQRSSDRSMKLLYVGIAVMVVGVLLTLMSH